MNRSSAVWDTIVVGAGPAGLTAALYLARYRRRVLVLHDGTSRALRIPLTRNVPGHPDGIAGPDLIARMIGHASQYGAIIEQAEVIDAGRVGALFQLTTQDNADWLCRTLILATGLHLNQIPLDPATHQAAIDAGVLRYCPICDGWEHIDRRIGVIGCDSQGASEALFLRRYSGKVTLLPRSFAELTPVERVTLDRAGVNIVAAPVRSYAIAGTTMAVELDGGTSISFDVVYPALGTRPRTALAKALGVHTESSGTLPAAAPLATEIPGLWSAGDLVQGLDQISTAFGQGAIAATKAHNWLREQDGETL